MPQGAVRRKPNGQLNGRQRGTVVRRASVDHANGRTPYDPSARHPHWQQAAAWWRDLRAQHRSERARPGPTRYPRRPRVKPGHLSTRRVRYNWGQARRYARQAQHARKGRRSGKIGRSVAFGSLAVGEIGIILGFRTTGAVLGLTAALLGGIGATFLARTNGTTTKSRSPGRTRR